MKTNRFLSILLCVFLLTSPFFAKAQQAINSPTTWQAYFSPRGGATAAIVQSLSNARSSVLVQAYSFTSTPIAEALVRAYRHGVKVLVFLDKSQRTRESSAANFLANAGIPVFIDNNHAIAHNKVIIIDSESVITGSFNFSKAAEERNAENLLIIRAKELAARFIKNWRILNHGHRNDEADLSSDRLRYLHDRPALPSHARYGPGTSNAPSLQAEVRCQALLALFRRCEEAPNTSSYRNWVWQLQQPRGSVHTCI